MTEVTQYTPDPSEFAWTFGGRPAVRKVRPGELLEIFTEDCFAGRVRSAEDLPSQAVQFPFLNPVTGPFHVEGAEPGDTLALHFVSIEPVRDWAVSTTFPLFGALTATHATAMLHEALEERVWTYELVRERRVARYQAARGDFSVELPFDPMHGTVGVAPAAFEALATITPAAHGGNMDTPEMRAGVTAYFGVNVDGALFGVGDGHARQGEGEVCGTAVECAMRTVVIPEVVKNVATPWPRLETDDLMMSTGSARPLEDAFRISQRDLVTWVAAEGSLDVLDAYQLVSQVGLAPAGNVCDTNYTMLAKAEKRYLPVGDLYQGVHRRLREQAAEYVRSVGGPE